MCLYLIRQRAVVNYATFAESSGESSAEEDDVDEGDKEESDFEDE
jgi:hypothetical protein